MKNIFITLACLVGFQCSFSQDTVHLKLNEAIEASHAGNVDIALARLERQRAESRFQQTNAVYLPQVQVSYTAMVSNNPLNAFGFKLQQQVISSTDFNPALLNHPDATQNYMAQAEVKQPLINLDLLYQRKAAREEVNLYDSKSKRTREFLTFEIQKAYAQLQLVQQSVDVWEQALRTSHAMLAATRDRYEKGYLQKADWLLVQVHHSSIETKLAEAKSSVSNLSDYISVLMGKKERPVYVTDSMENVALSNSLSTVVPDNRADFRSMNAALNAQQMMIHSGKMNYLPKLNAFANYMFNDPSAFGFGSGAYLLGAQLSWTLFNGTTTHHKIGEQRLTKSYLEQQLAQQKEQSQMELTKSLRQLKDTEFAIQQAQLAVSQSAEALRILQNRFQQGLVTTTDLLAAQTTHQQQKLHLSEAFFTYRTTQAYVQFLTTSSEK
jgi:outer membrane protein TolC